VVLNEPAFDEDGMEKLITQIARLQKSVRMELGATVSVGLGTEVEDMAGVRASHRYALIAVQYALALGENQMVPYGEIENTHTAASQNRTAITNAIDNFILSHLQNTELTPEDIANHIGLSVGYMRQLFRMERGIPINDYITSCRITKAQNLLSTTNLTAKRISEEVGYVDSRYFYTLFKKKTGETTEEYRLRMRQPGEELGLNDV
jgi:AraC-like DNA-binding protein